MRKPSRGFGWGVLVASVALWGAGGALWPATAEAQQAPAGLQQMTGTIVSVNLRGQELVLQEEGGDPIRLTVEKGTSISDGARALRLVDLRPGQAVEVRFAQKGGKTTAHSITVKTEGSSEAPGAAPMRESPEPRRE